MSMSQEEIEALMSGLDIQEEESSEEVEVPQEEVVKPDPPLEETVEEPEAVVEEPQEEPVEVDSPKKEESQEEPQEDEPAVEEDIEDILASIEGIEKSEETTPVTPEEPEQEVRPDDTQKEAIAKDWTDDQINQGVFPFPAEKNTKVVHQLSEVASDSEEKASMIFDVLSFILDENNELQKDAKSLDSFISKQILLLESLSKKFPDIKAFQGSLELAQSVQDIPKRIEDRTNEENNKLFEAMELMQFHDINRQKIERVMSVIKKLSNYLNNLFEDETGYSDIAVAKHISGDNNEDLVDEQALDDLIAEFAK